MEKRNDTPNLQHSIVSTTNPVARIFCLMCRLVIDENQYLILGQGDKMPLCDTCKPDIIRRMEECKPLMHKLQL
jgi:hypothetical protein